MTSYMYVITACGIETPVMPELVGNCAPLHVCHYRLRYWNRLLLCLRKDGSNVQVTCMSLPLAVLKLVMWSPCASRTRPVVTCMSLPLAVLKLRFFIDKIFIVIPLHVCHYRLRYWNAKAFSKTQQRLVVTCMSLPLAVLKHLSFLQLISVEQRIVTCMSLPLAVLKQWPPWPNSRTRRYMYVITACGIETPVTLSIKRR